MANFIRELVSKNKIRCVSETYNLDLSYILPNLIAMGFPASGLESYYRNCLEDVERFLQERHPGHILVINLCSKRHYPPERFNGSIRQIPFSDHQAPKFEQVMAFVETLKQWIGADEGNIGVVHCKAGKGRTGLMISCFLLDINFRTGAQEALEYYGYRRTYDGMGVTIPSQLRYVAYYEAYRKSTNLYVKREVEINEVYMKPLPSIFGLGSQIEIVLIFEEHCGNVLFSSTLLVKRTDSLACLRFDTPFPVTGDFKLTCKVKLSKKFGICLRTREVFHLWANTYFLKPEFNTALSHTTTHAGFHFKGIPRVQSGFKVVGQSVLKENANEDAQFNLEALFLRPNMYFRSHEECRHASARILANEKQRPRGFQLSSTVNVYRWQNRHRHPAGNVSPDGEKFIVRFKKNQLDGPHKDLGNTSTPADFVVGLVITSKYQQF